MAAGFADILNRLKNDPSLSRQEKRISISNESGAVLGYFLPVDQNSVDPALAETFARWRSRFMTSFLTQYDATASATLKWLQEIVLRDNSRILFAMYADEKLVGHLGLKNVNPTSFEVDNLIKGERGGGPKFVNYAILSLLDWSFRSLEARTAISQVLSSNTNTLLLDLALGFTKTKAVPLGIIEEHGKQSYVRTDLSSQPVGAPVADIYLNELQLTATTFYEMYPWITAKG